MKPSLLLLTPTLLAGCLLENGLSKPDSDPNVADSSPDEGVDTSSGDTSPDDTSDSGGTFPAVCPDRSIPGQSVALLKVCDSPAEHHPSWNLVEKWRTPEVSAEGKSSIGAPSVGQLNDDDGSGSIDENDTPDVVVALREEVVRAYDGASGALLWAVSTSNLEQSTPAIADLDGDGFPEVVVGGLAGVFALHGEDGSPYWSGRAPVQFKPACGAVGVADLEADGEPEVFLGNLVLDGQSGSLKSAGSAGVGTGYFDAAPMSIAADLDQNGFQEVIVGNAAYDYNGATVWTPGGSDGFPAIANFDADDAGEVVSVSSDLVRLLDDDGTELWMVPISGGGPPAVADVDGDSAPDAIVPTAAGVIALRPDGTEIWRTPTRIETDFAGVSAYDLDGDGAWEVLVNTRSTLLVLDGHTGSTLASYPTGGEKVCGQNAVVADLDADGSVEIILNVTAATASGAAPLVLADGLAEFVPGGRAWHEHDYAITNVNDDGTVPAVPEVNWLRHNNFRAGPSLADLVADVNLAPRIEDVCVDECDDGRLTIWYSVDNNRGGNVTTNLPLALYGQTDAGEVQLWTGTWYGDVGGGWRASAEQLELSGVPTPLYGLRLTLDGGNDATNGILDECDETDNEDIWETAVCP